jgi:hypothetical protein
MKKLLAASILSLLAFTTVACDKADEVVDCSKICNKYKDCLNNDYDVSACVDRCEDKTADNDDVSDQADACESCIDDRSCAGATFGCGAECVAFVP